MGWVQCSRRLQACPLASLPSLRRAHQRPGRPRRRHRHGRGEGCVRQGNTALASSGCHCHTLCPLPPACRSARRSTPAARLCAPSTSPQSTVREARQGGGGAASWGALPSARLPPAPCPLPPPRLFCPVFEAFDELLLLKPGGATIFFGPTGDAAERLIEYFQVRAGGRALVLGMPQEWPAGGGCTRAPLQRWGDADPSLALPCSPCCPAEHPGRAALPRKPQPSQL